MRKDKRYVIIVAIRHSCRGGRRKNVVGHKFKYAVFDVKQRILTKFSSQMFSYTQQIRLKASGDRPLTGRGRAPIPWSPLEPPLPLNPSLLTLMVGRLGWWTIGDRRAGHGSSTGVVNDIRSFIQQ